MPTMIATTEPPPAVVALHRAPAVDGPRATVRITARVPLAVAWEAFVPITLSDVFPKSKGPIPAVRGTSGQEGRWDVVGRSRSVHLADGRVVREEITASDPTAGAPPAGEVATFAYRVSGFSGPLSLIAREAHGDWRFEQVGPEQTDIRWTYTFVPKNWLGAVPLKLILRTFWRAYMRDGIDNVRLIAERQSGGGGGHE
jgi:hypothetical protein